MNTLKFAYFGVDIGLEWDSPDLDEFFHGLLLPIWRHDPELQPSVIFRALTSADGGLTIEGPGDEPQRAHRSDVFEALERRIHFYLANHCQGVVFVHAGAVAWQGRAIVIPGSSYSGKSTLTQALVAAGAEYLTDEYAVMDSAGLVHAFPRPICLRDPEGDRRVLPQRVCLTPLPVAAVVATRYQPEAEWEPELLSAGRGVMELIAHTVTAREAPALALSCLGACMQNALCWAGPRGAADETARLILGRVKSAAESPGALRASATRPARLET